MRKPSRLALVLFSTVLVLFLILLTLPVEVTAHSGSPDFQAQLAQQPTGPTNSDEKPPADADKHSKRAKSKKEEVVQTFTGLVEWQYKPLVFDCEVPNCDHFALWDPAAKRNYDLDDARKALPFEGKNVRVTGVLGKDSSIHVYSIEPLK